MCAYVCLEDNRFFLPRSSIFFSCISEIWNMLFVLLSRKLSLQSDHVAVKAELATDSTVPRSNKRLNHFPLKYWKMPLHTGLYRHLRITEVETKTRGHLVWFCPEARQSFHHHPSKIFPWVRIHHSGHLNTFGAGFCLAVQLAWRTDVWISCSTFLIQNEKEFQTLPRRYTELLKIICGVQPSESLVPRTLNLVTWFWPGRKTKGFGLVSNI